MSDANKIISHVSPSFSHITGYCAEELIGKTTDILCSGRHREGFYEAIWTFVEYDAYWQGEVWMARKCGEAFQAWLTISAIKGADECISQYVSSYTGTTIQKLAETVLLDARQRLENQLATSSAEPEKTKKDTEEVNIALNHVIKYLELDKSDTKIEFLRDVEATVYPLLRKLKEISVRRHQSVRLIGILETNLQHLMQTYGRTSNLTASYRKLTPVERQVASMVRQGLPTKVIAATLNISAETVNCHRKHIRKKLGLDSKSSSLYCHLIALTE